MELSKVRNITFNRVSFGNSRINALVFNDFHASLDNLDSFKTAHDEFKKEHENETNLVLSGGDNFIDKSENSRIVNGYLNEILDASAAGNHDLDGGDFFAKLIKDSKFKWVSSNLIFKNNDAKNSNIQKSVILHKNGEDIGVIGVSPLNFQKTAFLKKDNGYRVKTFNQTIKAVKKEVKKLEDKKINKIFLLAHTGEKDTDGIDYYKEFSKIGGIDVIVGGHDHKQTDFWGKTDRNEPVKVISTGRTKTREFGGNLDSFAELNMEFNNKGVLIKSKTKNTFKNTADYPKSNFVSKFIDPENFKTLYKLEKPLVCINRMTEENKSADIAADACLWYVNKHTNGEKADFAIVNSGTIRDNFEKTDVCFHDIKKVLPFTSSTLMKAKLTKKQIIDTLNHGISSTHLKKVSLGIMQVSGLKYTIGNDDKVKDVCLIDEKGRIKLRLDDVSDDREFNCVYDIFLATGVAGLADLKKDLEKDSGIEFFDCTRQNAVKEYFEAFQGKEIYDISYTRIKRD